MWMAPRCWVRGGLFVFRGLCVSPPYDCIPHVGIDVLHVTLLVRDYFLSFFMFLLFVIGRGRVSCDRRVSVFDWMLLCCGQFSIWS